MKQYKYILEPYKGKGTRYACPDCLEKDQFTKYIDIETNEYVNDIVGRCNREDKCGYHYSPREYFLNNDFKDGQPDQKRKKSKSKLMSKTDSVPSFIDFDVMKRSLESKEPNWFIDFLKDKFDDDEVIKVIEMYKIGTSNTWKGSTVFWQVDINGKIRTGKIMLYNTSTGKRVKKPYNHINWMHSVLKRKDFNLKQCLFGEHLLNLDDKKPVAIVESEKTAIISSIYFPSFIWLACGNANGLNKVKSEVLKGRNVALFPDLNCFDKWKDKIPKLNPLANVEISTLLEDKATDLEKEEGLDLADYLLSFK